MYLIGAIILLLIALGLGYRAEKYPLSPAKWVAFFITAFGSGVLLFHFLWAQFQ